MNSISLTVARHELIAALKTLGTVRRKKFVSVVPVWMRFDPREGTLSITEERNAVIAVVRASGSWPPAGATVNLFMLRNAAQALETETVELAAISDAILIPTPHGHVRMNLLPFGPESRRKARPSHRASIPKGRLL